MMWHDSPLQSFSKEFDLRGYPPIGVFTFFDRPASHRLPVASMHCMYQCMYMFTNKVGNAKKVSAANAWREIQSRYSTWLESHIIYSTSQQDGTYKMRVECLVFFKNSLDSTPDCHQIFSNRLFKPVCYFWGCKAHQLGCEGKEKKEAPGFCRNLPWIFPYDRR